MLNSPKEDKNLFVDRKGVKFAIKELQIFKKKFDNKIKKYLQDEIKRAKKIRPEIADLVGVGKRFILRGGKRIRPAFFYYGYKAGGGRNNNLAINASMSTELLHTGLLIHDDIVDNSDTRRGGPTVHKMLSDKLKDEEFGKLLAIILGDVFISLGVKVLTDFPSSSDRLCNARRCFDMVFLNTNYGQCLDLLGNTREVDIGWVEKVLEYKTARYTVEGPLVMGAHLAGADKNIIKALSKYGLYLGTAFQIHDDILGMFGSFEKVGKSIDSDLKEGKKTFLIIKALEKLEKSQKKDKIRKLNKILGNPTLTKRDYLWVQNIIRGTDALEDAQKHAWSLIKKAKKSISEVSISANAKKYLMGIADYMLLRNY